MLQIMPALPKEAQALADSTASVKTQISEQLHSLAAMPAEEAVKTVMQSVVHVSLKILLAVAIYLVGRWIIRRLLKAQQRLMERRNTDPSLRVFLNNLSQITLMIMLISTIVGVMGINTTSFVAIFASAGLAVGMALSGTLQNFAGGIMILAIKPFRAGDFIEAQGQSGTVKEIRLFHTVLNTPDNKTILLPNGGISTSILNNYSHEPIRRVEWILGVGYGEDYDRVKAVIFSLLQADKRILQEPAPLIALHTLAGSSVNIVVRAWVASEQYWDLYFSLNEQVYKRFYELGINIPFPQLDVHMKPAPGRASAEE